MTETGSTRGRLAATSARAAGALKVRAAAGVRSGYYRAAYGRSFPGSAALARAMTEWEARTGRGDVPKDERAWDAQYADHGWDFLDGLAEASHYGVIVSYLSLLAPGGSILDVGCGSGVLFDRAAVLDPPRYVGVDISAVAVAELSRRAPAGAEFVAADAETFTPAERFDAVVFNESITYFRNPEQQFRRYLGAVAPGGVAIVSCHQQSARAQAILRRLEREHTVLDETVVRQQAVSWRVVVFRGPPA